MEEKKKKKKEQELALHVFLRRRLLLLLYIHLSIKETREEESEKKNLVNHTREDEYSPNKTIESTDFCLRPWKKNESREHVIFLPNAVHNHHRDSHFQNLLLLR